MSESDAEAQHNSIATKAFTVEVAYATPEKQVIIEMCVAPGTCLEQAIEQSEICRDFPEIDLSKNKVGIFGKLAKKSLELKPGDRIEVYRPLIADPKEVRRKREAEGKRMKKGGGEKSSL